MRLLISNLRIFGALRPEDLYNMNSVVSHNGVFYRSLYDANIEEPGTGSKWIEIESLTP